MEGLVEEQFSHLVRLRSTDITFYRNVISRYIFEVYGVLRDRWEKGKRARFPNSQFWISSSIPRPWSRCGNCCSSMEAMCAT